MTLAYSSSASYLIPDFSTAYHLDAIPDVVAPSLLLHRNRLTSPLSPSPQSSSNRRAQSSQAQHRYHQTKPNEHPAVPQHLTTPGKVDSCRTQGDNRGPAPALEPGKQTTASRKRGCETGPWDFDRRSPAAMRPEHAHRHAMRRDVAHTNGYLRRHSPVLFCRSHDVPGPRAKANPCRELDG
jgi:hypothetical protein